LELQGLFLSENDVILNTLAFFVVRKNKFPGSPNVKKGVFMKNYVKIFGVVVLVSLLAFVMISCGEDSIDPNLVGKWYSTQEKPEFFDDFPMYNFTADGRFLLEGDDLGFTYSADGALLQIKTIFSIVIGSANYTVNGDVLSITGNAGGFVDLLVGDFYKRLD
jgi:hypothetical protein